MSLNAICEIKFSQKFLNLQNGEMPFSVAVHLDLRCQSTRLGVSSTQMLYSKRCMHGHLIGDEYFILVHLSTEVCHYDLSSSNVCCA